jgi:putative membrane protein
MYWGSGWHMFSWWILWAVLIIGVIWMIRRPANPSREDDSPETILKRRYARGEIDREEYERRLADLRK